MTTNPYSPPAPSDQESIRRNWAVALATVAGIAAAVVLAALTVIFVCFGTGLLLVNADGVNPVMAVLVSLGLGLIAAFGVLVLVVRLTFRLLEQDGEE